MDLKRVVVTGMGAVSPLGNTVEENWKNVIAEYAYIVDPAVAELNELFGAK